MFHHPRVRAVLSWLLLVPLDCPDCGEPLPASIVLQQSLLGWLALFGLGVVTIVVAALLVHVVRVVVS